MKKSLVPGLVFGLFLLGGRSFAQQFNYVSIDVPCSCPDQIARQTVANSINSAGDIVGVFTEAPVIATDFCKSPTRQRRLTWTTSARPLQSHSASTLRE